MSSEKEKSKIIVDDDWKTRVQAEKESFRTDSASPQSTAQPPSQSEAPDDEEHLPPASFESLISMIVTQALAALGQIPIGEERQPVVMLDHAKHHIDLLAMLEEKTKGNLNQAEANVLTNLLHELRMVFVSVTKTHGQPPP